MAKATRAKVETIRTMTTPYAEFEAKGDSGQGLVHAKAGPLDQPDNFDAMAQYVGDSRELMKWDAASQAMRSASSGHVHPIMQEFLHQAEGVHREAAALFHQAHYLGQIDPKKINTATSSTAGPLQPTETLASTQYAAATGTRPRALSDPRVMRSPPKPAPSPT